MEIQYKAKTVGTFVRNISVGKVFIHQGNLFTRVLIGDDLVSGQTDPNVCYVYNFGENCVLALDGGTFIHPSEGPFKSKLEVYGV